MAAQWYQNHLSSATTRILLITNDRENKRKAAEEGIYAETGTTWYCDFTFLLSCNSDSFQLCWCFNYGAAFCWCYSAITLYDQIIPHLLLMGGFQCESVSLMTHQFVSVESYVKSLGQPALLDLIVQPHTGEDAMEIEDLRPSKRKVMYSEVLMATT